MPSGVEHVLIVSLEIFEWEEFPDLRVEMARPCPEQETRFYLIDTVLRAKGYNDYQWLKLEPPAPDSVAPTSSDIIISAARGDCPLGPLQETTYDRQRIPRHHSG